MKNIYSFFILSTFFLISSFAQPSITTYNPLNDSEIEDVSQDLILTFSESIAFNPEFSFLEINLYNADTGSPVETWTCIFGGATPGASISDNQLIINPTDNLSEATNYYITIDNGAIVNFNGIDNSESNYWRFSTSSPLTFYPTQGATDFPLDDNLTLTFQNDIHFNTTFNFLYIRLYNSDLGLVESWLCINGSGQSGVSISSNQLIINPTDDLIEGTNYYITIDDGAIEGYSGIDNSENNNWRFKTIAYAPTPITFNPIQNSTNVPLNQTFQLTFDRNIQWTNVTSEYKILLRSGGTTIEEYIISPGYIDSNLAIDGDQLISDRLNITLYGELDINTSYFIIIPSGIIESTYGASFEGINNSESNNWRFTTIGLPIWADSYPSTDNLTLTDIDLLGQTDKDGTYNYVVSANATMPSVSQIKNGYDGIGAAALITNSATPGNMVANTDFSETLNISSFTAETTYYIYIVATSTDGSLDSEIIQVPFTTLERNAPIVTFDPADQSTGVSILTDIILTFDEPVRMLNGTIIDNSNVSSLLSLFKQPETTPVDFTATISQDKTTITITTTENLNQSSSYEVTILAVEDYYGNQQSSSSTASFSTATLSTWLGNTSTWADEDNWSTASIPDVNSSVLIPLTNINPVITGDVEINHLYVEAGASITIESTGTLTVNGVLDLESSTTGNGNASLINKSTTAVNVDPSKVSIHQVFNASNRTYHISSPVIGATKNNTGVDLGIQSYDNATDSWIKLGNDDVLESGNGYIARSTQSITFTGTMNNSTSYAIPLVRTNGAGYGWNLVGNPYPAAINWDAIHTSYKNNIYDAYWIFLNDVTNYGVYATYSPVGGGTNGLDSIIPSNQSYFVKVLLDQSSGTITIPKSAIETNNKSILKSAKASYPKIKLAAINGTYSDETIIAFADIASDGEDIYDATKMFGSNSNYIELFTVENGENYAINCKNTLCSDIVIPLGIKVYKTGNYSIQLKQESSIFHNYNVYLEDKEDDNLLINLQETPNYQFSTATKGTIVDRFNILFSEKTSTDITSNESNTITVYSENKNIIVTGDELEQNKYEIFSVSGESIKNGILNNPTYNTIKMQHQGIFIIRISNNETNVSKKVLVK